MDYVPFYSLRRTDWFKYYHCLDWEKGTCRHIVFVQLTRVDLKQNKKKQHQTNKKTPNQHKTKHELAWQDKEIKKKTQDY